MPKTLNRVFEDHRAFIRTLFCCACGAAPTVFAHVRASTWGDVVVPLEERGGTGIKPADKWAVPLCQHCHTDQHQYGEQTFWKAQDINPLELAQALWANTGNRTACLGIILRRRNGATEL